MASPATSHVSSEESCPQSIARLVVGARSALMGKGYALEKVNMSTVTSFFNDPNVRPSDGAPCVIRMQGQSYPVNITLQPQAPHANTGLSEHGELLRILHMLAIASSAVEYGWLVISEVRISRVSKTISGSDGQSDGSTPRKHVLTLRVSGHPRHCWTRFTRELARTTTKVVALSQTPSVAILAPAKDDCSQMKNATNDKTKRNPCPKAIPAPCPVSTDPDTHKTDAPTHIGVPTASYSVELQRISACVKSHVEKHRILSQAVPADPVKLVSSIDAKSDALAAPNSTEGRVEVTSETLEALMTPSQMIGAEKEVDAIAITKKDPMATATLSCLNRDEVGIKDIVISDIVQASRQESASPVIPLQMAKVLDTTGNGLNPAELRAPNAMQVVPISLKLDATTGAGASSHASHGVQSHYSHYSGENEFSRNGRALNLNRATKQLDEEDVNLDEDENERCNAESINKQSNCETRASRTSDDVFHFHAGSGSRSRGGVRQRGRPGRGKLSRPGHRREVPASQVEPALRSQKSSGREYKPKPCEQAPKLSCSSENMGTARSEDHKDTKGDDRSEPAGIPVVLPSSQVSRKRTRSHSPDVSRNSDDDFVSIDTS